MSVATMPALDRRAPLAGWKAHCGALGALTAALLLVFRHDAAAMAKTWWTISTYEHCLVIVPIIAWLVWQRVPLMRGLAPHGWPLALAWIAAGGLCWLVGDAAGVALARQLGLVLMLQGAVATLLGRGVTVALLFPLFYALLLVPAGDGLIPPLQTVTARLCMVFLHVVRVPATIDGVYITTPAGLFKVAEACSGAKFLVAMIALGLLVANLGFRSWSRRAGFMAVCIAVPVLANGVRAFTTIWVAQYRGAAAAAGFDHVVYGWIFFAVVIALVLAASWRFFDRPADAPPFDRATADREAARQRVVWPLVPATLAAFAIATAAPGWSAIVAAGSDGALSVSAPTAPAGWQAIAAPAEWRPRFDGATIAMRAYRDGDGHRVDVAIAAFAAQGAGRSLVGYGHGAADPDGPWSWTADLPAPADGRAERLFAAGRPARTVVSFYDVGGAVTGSPARTKLETLRRRLLGGDQRAAALLVSADETGGGRAAIDAFLAALGPVRPVLVHAMGPR